MPLSCTSRRRPEPIGRPLNGQTHHRIIRSEIRRPISKTNPDTAPCTYFCLHFSLGKLSIYQWDLYGEGCWSTRSDAFARPPSCGARCASKVSPGDNDPRRWRRTLAGYISPHIMCSANVPSATKVASLRTAISARFHRRRWVPCGGRCGVSCSARSRRSCSVGPDVHASSVPGFTPRRCRLDVPLPLPLRRPTACCCAARRATAAPRRPAAVLLNGPLPCRPRVTAALPAGLLLCRPPACRRVARRVARRTRCGCLDRPDLK